MNRSLGCISLAMVVILCCAACRRENPAVVRAAGTATAATISRQATAVVATATAVVAASSSSASSAATARRARVAAGNLGVAATGISAGIQLWSRPGGVMAGGATMTGTVSDGAEVDVINEADFLGQKYFQIRDASKEGWIDGRFLQLN